MTFHITALYASIIAIGVIVLSNIVSAQRGRAGVSILHGDNLELAVWIRRHGNLVENAPLALILMLLCEANGLGATWLHAMGIVLVVARVAHVFGLGAERPICVLRIVGGAGTQLVMLAAVVFLLWSQL